MSRTHRHIPTAIRLNLKGVLKHSAAWHVTSPMAKERVKKALRKKERQKSKKELLDY